MAFLGAPRHGVSVFLFSRLHARDGEDGEEDNCLIFMKKEFELGAPCTDFRIRGAMSVRLSEHKRVIAFSKIALRLSPRLVNANWPGRADLLPAPVAEPPSHMDRSTFRRIIRAAEEETIEVGKRGQAEARTG